MGQDAGECRRQYPALPIREPRPPDFCNLGTWLRVLLGVNAMALVAALARNKELSRLLGEFAELAAFVEPIGLASLVTLCAGRRWLARLPASLATLVVVGVVVLAGATFAMLLAPIVEAAESLAWRIPLWSALAAVVLLAWFDLSARAHAPALSEARLMALTARIRPHFLFNSLNAVLGVIRSDPRQAERALEALADLFRALMQENRELVPLSAEIALARQYLDLERLRLGERLQVRWDVESCPPDARVPPLMLQPLLENAVYHGIEPLADPGEVHILLARRQDRLLIELTNPCSGLGTHHGGNRMALANIRERLLLFFDLEATLTTDLADGRYRVRIELPYRKGEPS
jgi:two-component system, LytTR family, sensor histidine kinase AlgZ